eukprot:scaffold266427_cov25-Tisochrysis_lutea.AAC.2
MRLAELPHALARSASASARERPPAGVAPHSRASIDPLWRPTRQTVAQLAAGPIGLIRRAPRPTASTGKVSGCSPPLTWRASRPCCVPHWRQLSSPTSDSLRHLKRKGAALTHPTHTHPR